MINLQSYIKSVGIAKAAHEFHVSRSSAYAYMIGTRKPRIDKAKEIAALKDWSLNQIYPTANSEHTCDA